MADGYNVKLQEYCSYCKDFSPVLDQANITAFGDKIGKFSNSISCKNAERCEYRTDDGELGNDYAGWKE